MTNEESLSARVRTFLSEPDIFFRQLAEKPARYRWPFLIALITGLCTAVAAWLEMSWMFSFFSPGFSLAGRDAGIYSTTFTLVAIAGSVSEAISPFVILFVAGFGFFILAGVVSKSGSLSHTITAVGWGMVPLAIYGGLRISLAIAFLPSMSITVSPEFYTLLNNASSASSIDPAALAQMITYNQAFYTYLMIGGSLKVLAILCCAWFWIPAVRNTCTVSHRQATMIVLVPLLLYLIVTFGPALVTGGYGL